MQNEASALLETLAFTLGVITTSNAADRHRIAQAYYEAQGVVVAIEAENDHTRPRILACLERFKVCKAEDDIAAAGWMLAALQIRIDERGLADWEKLKVVADGTAQLLLTHETNSIVKEWGQSHPWVLRPRPAWLSRSHAEPRIAFNKGQAMESR